MGKYVYGYKMYLLVSNNHSHNDRVHKLGWLGEKQVQLVQLSPDFQVQGTGPTEVSPKGERSSGFCL